MSPLCTRYCTYIACCDHSQQSVQARQRPFGCNHSVPGTVHTYPAVTSPNSLTRLDSDLLDVTTLYQVLFIHIQLWSFPTVCTGWAAIYWMSPPCTRYCTVHTYPAVTIPNSLNRLGSDLLDVTTLSLNFSWKMIWKRSGSDILDVISGTAESNKYQQIFCSA